MKNETLRMGLLGYPVAHSKSPELFRTFAIGADIMLCYELYERAGLTDLRHELERLFEENDLDGLNVTSPYKEDVAHVMDRLSPRARGVDAVNLVRYGATGFFGDNTDLVGCAAMLAEFAPTKDAPFVVLGAGGAARVVLKTLQEMKREVYVVNRTETKGRSVAERYGATYLSYDELVTLRKEIYLFSALPPSAALPALPTSGVLQIYDVAYIDSPLKRWAHSQHIPYQDGYRWLYAQAEENFHLLVE